MKLLLLFFLPGLFALPSAAQTRTCYCDKDTMMNQLTTDCSTTLLRNGSKLYWQFNCDSIWLTLEQRNGHKLVLDTLPVNLYPYLYRLGFQLEKEYARKLLFRAGCPANGPCMFVLVDKSTGKRLREFGELIYDRERKEFFDFLLYLSSGGDLVLEYINSGKKYKLPVDTRHFDQAIPEYQFGMIRLQGKELILPYTFWENDLEKEAVIRIDLRKYPG